MSEERKPELFTDKDIEELVSKVYDNCMELNCDNCPCANEVEDGICKSDIIMELWRKWHNAKNTVQVELEIGKITKHQSDFSDLDINSGE